MRTREIHLAARPQGWPTEDNFRLVEVDLPDPGPGQVLVANTLMSVDPYMRGRMNDAKSYVAPFQVDRPLDGGATGVVLAAGEGAGLAEGATVLHGAGWREHAVVEAAHVRAVDVSLAPAEAYLGVLGMPGLTAYAGIVDVAGMRPGETVFVSGAAGAVGSLAGQIAKLRGAARVIGSAGSPAKVSRLVEELGFDAAFDYHDGPVRHRLREAAPDGIDVYFDNVGGEQLEAAISALRTFGRVAMCGAISQYNEVEPVGPRNLALAVGKRLTLRGFLVGDHNDLRPALLTEVGGWLREGRLHAPNTYVDGLAHAPAAFLGMLRGDNIGKMLVRLGASLPDA